MTETIDQATKDLIKKEAEEYGYDIPSAVQGYVRGATIWAERLKQESEQLEKALDDLNTEQHLVRVYKMQAKAAQEQLAKERGLRKELVEWIEGYVDLEELADPKRIELLVQKAKNLSA